MKTKKAESESPLNSRTILNQHEKELWDLRLACWNNAKRLLEDSKYLLKRKRFPSSFFLSYTALEELGKYLFVCDYITGIVSEKEFIDSFSDHKLKIAYAHSNVELTKQENGFLKATIVYNKNKFDEWMIYRNNSLYVNSDDRIVIKKPEDEISEDLALKMYTRAKNEMDTILLYENVNERIGSKALYK